ncbi:SSI family serine proteinase inhibitor [Streptomyces sp. NPDC058231]|uniref:SSI family serine proteinase inhibitor n=1 Tax=Streptomyces sp. NPDC058231 TaxID=3346392 RepID=UPI0036E7E250
MIITSAGRALAAAALTAVALATPLLSPPAAHADARGGSLFLTVSGSGNTWIRGLALQCPPIAESHHPRAAEACAALEEAGGDLDGLRGDRHPCPLILDPVTVTAEGSYDGHPVEWRRTYPNSCVLEADTGPVFRF